MGNELEIVGDYMSRHPVDVESLIRDLGIIYREIPLPASQSGMIESDGVGYWITVNASEAPQRRRFTAAHELAHYLLHRDLLEERGQLSRHVDVLFGDGARDNPTYPFSPAHEVQANKLAADIIMPERHVRAMYDCNADNFRELARRFGVSSLAMRIRLNNLGLGPPVT